MKLDRVTITGADDSIEPYRLRDLTYEFPFAEWGILASPKRTGEPRYPSVAWTNKLAALNLPRVSTHLCGGHARSVIVGEANAHAILPMTLICASQRVQLNFNSPEGQGVSPKGLARVCRRFGKQVIVQWRGGNTHMYLTLKYFYPDLVLLFDRSGGRGEEPASWPAPVGEYFGYAGGLGPDNLAQRLEEIAAVAGDSRIWIDMETKVRSDDDARFDLDKVRACLEIAKPFIVA